MTGYIWEAVLGLDNLFFYMVLLYEAHREFWMTLLYETNKDLRMNLLYEANLGKEGKEYHKEGVIEPIYLKLLKTKGKA